MAGVSWFSRTAIVLLMAAGLSPAIQAQQAQQAESSAGIEEAIFGGGCFWCMEEAFEKIKGVKTVESGYSGGKIPSPTYEQVSGGKTGHVEVIRVRFDPKQVSYPNLLKQFWVNVDPTVENRQFCDTGEQYRSVIFYMNPTQQQQAARSKEEVLATGKVKKIYTTLEPAQSFYVAEEYHQDFYKKNPLRYQYYKTSCGRENRLKEIWGAQKQLN